MYGVTFVPQEAFGIRVWDEQLPVESGAVGIDNMQSQDYIRESRGWGKSGFSLRHRDQDREEDML